MLQVQQVVRNFLNSGFTTRIPLKIGRSDFTRSTSTVSIGIMSHHPTTRLTIGTHDGSFHCDEVLACVILKWLPRYTNAEIIRTRDEAVLRTCDIVVDVGGIYDPINNRFDHHQRSFDHSMSTVVPGKPWTTRLSSAGLVYAHFGREMLSALFKDRPLSVDEDGLEKVYDKVYEDFMQSIDAIDNGVPLNEHPLAYKVTTDLSSRVSFLNPGWKDIDVNENERFDLAMKLGREELIERIFYYVDYWLEAYNVVRDAVKARFEVDSSGEIVEFPTGGVPWKDHLSKLEVSLNIETPIQYVIFPDGKGKWRIQCVPIEPKSFITRTPLKKEWQGVRDSELEELSRIPTILFVHANGFIGGAAERSSVIRMAKESLLHRQ